MEQDFDNIIENPTISPREVMGFILDLIRLNKLETGLTPEDLLKRCEEDESLYREAKKIYQLGFKVTGQESKKYVSILLADFLKKI